MRHEIATVGQKKPKLFIGLEETNIQDFVSPCCGVGLSIEPLCRIACGQCGQTVREEQAVYVGLVGRR